MANKNNDKTDRKPEFLKAFRKSLGVIQPALDAVNISRETYLEWRRKDEEFRLECEKIEESQMDFVENKLLQSINANDTTAEMFYLKTRGLKRGWNEKYNLAKAMQPVPPESKPSHSPSDIHQMLEDRKKHIIDAIADRYSPDLYAQVDATAKLMVQQDLLWEELAAEGFNFSTIETSREGSIRERPNEKVQTYLNISASVQSALRRLGMNLDARDRKADSSNTTDFLERHADDGD